MSDIKTWSASAANNNAASPNGFPEGMAPSGVNDAAREVMAGVRRWYEDAQWIDFGHAPVYVSATSFTVATDVTAVYSAGRRLRLGDTMTLYGTVTASNYTTPNTTVTVTLDSGSLSGSLSGVALAILTASNVSFPTIPVTSGGTGAGTAAAARTNLGAQADVITTRGDVIVGNSSNVASRIALGAAGSALVSDGTDAKWGAPSLPRSYLAGLGLANNALDPTNSIDVAAGSARDDGDSANLSLASVLTKKLNAAWTAGSGNGGLDTGSKAASTWYHVWLIKRSDTGVVDALFSTSAASPTMPASYDKKRRIGAVKTDGTGNIIAFIQVGDEFWWATPVLDINSLANSSSSSLQTLSTPLGISILALATATVSNGTTVYYSYPSVNDTAVTISVPPFQVGPVGNSGGEFAIRTNTLSQIRVRCNASTGTNSLATLGWVDKRGRDD